MAGQVNSPGLFIPATGHRGWIYRATGQGNNGYWDDPVTMLAQQSSHRFTINQNVQQVAVGQFAPISVAVSQSCTLVQVMIACSGLGSANMSIQHQSGSGAFSNVPGLVSFTVSSLFATIYTPSSPVNVLNTDQFSAYCNSFSSVGWMSVTYIFDEIL